MKHRIGKALAFTFGIASVPVFACSPVDLKQLMLDATSNAYRLWIFTAVASSIVVALYLRFFPRRWRVPSFAVLVTLLHPAWTMAGSNFPAASCATPVEEFGRLALALVLVVGAGGLTRAFVQQRLVSGAA